MEFALFLTFLAAAIGGMIAVGVWILGPLDRAAGNGRSARQFTVADFLALVFLLQLPLGLIHARFAPPESRTVWLLDFFACGSVLALWLKSVGVLSRAGIRRSWHRGVFLTLVLPVAYAGLTPVVAILGIVLNGTLIDPGALDRSQLGVLAAALGGVIAAILVSARFTRHMVLVAAAEAMASEVGDAN